MRVIERDGEPWFAGKDVCAVLGIRDHHQALEKLDEDERGGCVIPTPMGDQNMIVVSEPGVYRLVFTSRKPEAERFKRWLAHDVLPEIRKTGQYRAGSAPSAPFEEPHLALQRMALTLVTEARMIYGIGRARALWESLPALPPVPLAPAALALEGGGVSSAVLECLTHLLDHPIDDDMRTVGELLRNPDDLAREAMEALGIRPVESGFWIAAGKPEMRALWARTRWREGIWASLIKKLPGVTGGHERMSIGGYQCRPIWFPFSALV
ncbi:MAG: Bro-N domain-containing protein [Allorhizobium sp.]